MILKNDQWLATAEGQEQTLRGAINFRRVADSSLYGMSQPTAEGIGHVLDIVRNEAGQAEQVAWINLR